MKTKLLEQPIEETTIIRDKGILVDSYKSFRQFETFIASAEFKGNVKCPLTEENSVSYARDHTGEEATIVLTPTSIMINTPRIKAQNWWGVMNKYAQKILLTAYIRDLLEAGYTVKGGETL